jgi:hypothetical protein
MESKIEELETKLSQNEAQKLKAEESLAKVKDEKKEFHKMVCSFLYLFLSFFILSPFFV